MGVDLVAGHDRDLFQDIARSCGQTVVECSNVGGIVASVMERSEKLHQKRDSLEDIAKLLEEEQAQLAHSSDDARELARNANRALRAGAETVRHSLEEFAELLDLVSQMGAEVTSFAAAMDQVLRTSQTIQSIAKSTNMLALNAAIEAERAGAAGATFAVVAAEVKSLSQETRRATDEINRTLGSLSSEANKMMEKVEAGLSRSESARQRLGTLDGQLAEASDLVSQVDDRAIEIAANSASAREHTEKVCDNLFGFLKDVGENRDELSRALRQTRALEQQSNHMFDRFLHSGLSDDDNRYIAITRKGRDEIAMMVERAFGDGSLTEAQFFSRDYAEIPGSNPKRYDNPFNDWADENIRPLLDRYCDMDAKIYGVIASNQDGYLPTHQSHRCRQPTGDPKHDAEFCRNRRKILDDITAEAVRRRDEDFIAAAYRFDQGEGRYEVLKNIFMPLWVRGRYWGNFEVAYLL